MYRPMQCPPLRSSAPVRGFAFLRCLLLVLAALGSNACWWFQTARSGPNDRAIPDSASLPTDACRDGRCTVSLSRASAATSSDCSTGTCDPRTVNAQGIYIATASDYCLDDDGGTDRYCPEAFVNLSSGVMLLVRSAQNPTAEYKAPMSATLAVHPRPEEPVELRSIRAEQTRLVITYKTSDGQEHSVTGGEVSGLLFRFAVARDPELGPGSPEYEMKVEPVDHRNSDGLRRPHYYRLFFKQHRPYSDWKAHCNLNGVTQDVSFLGGRRIDGLTAKVEDAPDTTTVSCETGAIDSCLAWGYAPWNPDTGSPEASEYLFRSCLQAKRAAYFVGLGDSTSYTVPGTPIAKRDAYGINTERIDRLEALWSPLGAECLISDNLRHGELVRNRDLLERIPKCTPVQWSEHGKLATGPAQSAP